MYFQRMQMRLELFTQELPTLQAIKRWQADQLVKLFFETVDQAEQLS
jgi:hypothetical protein